MSDYTDGGKIRSYGTKMAQFLAVSVWDDSRRGYWKYELNVADVPVDGKRAALVLLKAIWLRISRRGNQIGSWVWIPSE